MKRISFSRTKLGIVIGLFAMIALAALVACEQRRSSSEKDSSQNEQPAEGIRAVESPEIAQRTKMPVTRVEDLLDPITASTQPPAVQTPDQTTTKPAELPPPELCAIFRRPEESDRQKIDWAKLAWEADGAPELSAESLKLLQAEAPMIDPAALGIDSRAGNWLHFWFTHPYFDDRTETSARLLTTSGNKELAVKNELYGQWQSTSLPSSPTLATHVFCLDPSERLPDFCTVELTYSLGAWTYSRPLKPSEIDDASPLPGVRIPVINEAPDGETVVTALVDQKLSERQQFELVAILQDGQELTPSSSNAQITIERQWLRHLLFKAPLAEISALRWRTRPILRHSFDRVPLKPPTEREK